MWGVEQGLTGRLVARALSVRYEPLVCRRRHRNAGGWSARETSPHGHGGAGRARISTPEGITMNAQTVTIDQPLAPTQMRDGQQRLEAREQAALRRVAAQ